MLTYTKDQFEQDFDYDILRIVPNIRRDGHEDSSFLSPDASELSGLWNGLIDLHDPAAARQQVMATPVPQPSNETHNPPSCFELWEIVWEDFRRQEEIPSPHLGFTAFDDFTFKFFGKWPDKVFPPEEWFALWMDTYTDRELVPYDQVPTAPFRARTPRDLWQAGESWPKDLQGRN